MLLVECSTGHLVEVLNVKTLFDPFESELSGRYNVGEDVPPLQSFKKADLGFQSGEPLPKCWLDPHYRDDELKHHSS